MSEEVVAGQGFKQGKWSMVGKAPYAMPIDEINL